MKETERAVWLELEEVRSRLEAMTEFVAMTFKATYSTDIADRQNNHDKHDDGNSDDDNNNNNNHNNNGDNGEDGNEDGDMNDDGRIKIAIIAPATTRGTVLNIDEPSSSFDVKSIPLCAALLTSLYKTCEDSYSYTVFLAVNEDDVLANTQMVRHI